MCKDSSCFAGRSLWLAAVCCGWGCFAERRHLKNSRGSRAERRPGGAKRRRAGAERGFLGSFLSAGATAKQPKKLQTAARHKRSRSKKRRILSSHVFRMIRGRFAGSGRSPTLVVPRPKEKIVAVVGQAVANLHKRSKNYPTASVD